MLAASLGYTTLLCLVPLLASSLVLIKAFPAFKSLEGQLERVLLNHFVAGSAEQVQSYIHHFLEQALKLSLFGSLFLLVSAVLLIFSLEKAFNQIWKTSAHRKGIAAFLMYWGVLTLIPVLVALGIGFANYLSGLPWVVALLDLSVFKHVSSWVISYSLTFLAFLFLYISVPACKVRVSCAIKGGLVAALFFECAKRLFSLYIIHFSNYKVLYGSLAAIPLFLIWLYIAWSIILLGVQVTQISQKSIENSS